MIDTTPVPGLREIGKGLTEARTEQRWLARRLAVATTEAERDRLRTELGLRKARIDRLEAQREQAVKSPAFERR